MRAFPFRFNFLFNSWVNKSAASERASSGRILSMAASLDDNIRLNAEIAQLNAETARLQAETLRIQAESRSLNVEFSKKWFQIDKLLAETRKFHSEPPRVQAETKKLEREARWFPFQVLAGVIAAVFAIFAAAAGFLKFIDWFKP